MSQKNDDLEDFDAEFEALEAGLDETSPPQTAEVDFSDTSFDETDTAAPAAATGKAAGDSDAAKKKRQMFFYGMIAVVVLAVGGFLAMNLLGKSETSQTDQQAAIPADSSAADAQTPASTAQQPDVQTMIGEKQGGDTAQSATQNDAAGLFENPEVATQASAPVASTPENPAAQAAAEQKQNTAPQSGGDVFGALDNTSGAATPVADSAIPAAPSQQPAAEQPTVTQPNADTWAVPQTTEAAPVQVGNQPPAPVSMPDAAGTTQSTAVATQPAPAETLPIPQADAASTTQPSPPVLENALAAVPTATSAVPASATTESLPVAADSAEVKALKDKVAELEAKLSAMAAEQASAATQPLAAAPKEPVVSKVVTTESSAPKAKTTHKKKRSVKKVASSHYDGAYSPKASSSAPANGVALRGVSNGSAIVAVNGSIQQVHVGDTVKGLGRVTSIGKTADGWTVQGTSGHVSQ